MRKPRSVHCCCPSKSVSCPRSSLRIHDTSRALTTNQPSLSTTSPASVFFSSASATEDVGAGLPSSITQLLRIGACDGIRASGGGRLASCYSETSPADSSSLEHLHRTLTVLTS